MAAVAVFMLGSLQARSETIPATDSKVTYIGRTLSEGTSVSFDWTGVYIRIKFEGSSLSMKLSDTGKNYYNVWIDAGMDQAPDKIISTFGQDSTITLFSAAKRKPKRVHQVILQKRTEGWIGRTTIQEFTCDSVMGSGWTGVGKVKNT